VIAATNKNLESLVAAGRFREDLFYRLNVFTVRVPTLDERLDDLPLLVEHFIHQSSRPLGKHVRAVAAETMDRLRQHAWPGNVRELQSTIKYALVHAAGEVLSVDCLPPNLRAAPVGPPATVASEPSQIAAYVRRLLAENQPDVYYKVQAVVDRIVLDEVLRHVKGNQVEAAQLLGVSRNTLRAKLRGLGLTMEKHMAPDPEQAGQ
jgi:DNA-binding NtrC family response regulator